jgi:predicted NBD/HSP70 family sugar kinase
MTNKLGLAQRLSYQGSDSSRGAVLQLLFSNRDLSRAHISRVSGLSKQTISSVMADLENAHLVEETGITEGGIGRRAQTYRLSPRAGFAVGIDLGGTNFRSGLVDFSGNVLGELNVETPHSSVDELLQIMSKTISQLFKNANVPVSELAQIVIGIPGAVNPATGVISNAPNLEYLDNLVLSNLIQAKFDVPTLVENDVNVAALGELEKSKTEDFGFIAIGTGVGMGLILDGELRRGFNGGAGEIGYLPLGENVNQLSKEGHFEELIGGHAVESRYLKQVKNKKTLIEIFESASKGDLISEKIVDELGSNIALGIRAICSVLDLGEIILGGGIGSREDLYSKIVEELQRTMQNPPSVKISTLGARAGLVGAMSYALSEMRGHVLTHGSLMTASGAK